MTIKIFLPQVSLFGLPVRYAFSLIMQAGFSGVEVLATSANRTKADNLRSLAKAYGLRIHWHQPWSLTENTLHWYNHLASWLGILEASNYKLNDIMPQNRAEPIVIYADRWKEVWSSNMQLAWFQTCSVMNSEGKHTLSYQEFLKVLGYLHNPRIVFDTQHFLEWYFKCPGISGLPTDAKRLEDALLEGWNELRPYVSEIHLNDFDPRKGNSWGRNLILGRGIAPLESFATAVCRSDWHGVVTPEVSPFHLFPYRLKTTRYVRDYAAALFSVP